MMSLPPRLQQLEARLAGLASSGDGSEPMMLSELDGFIAGLLLCPEMILPSEWLPVVLGDDDADGGTHSSEVKLQDCVQLVLGHYNAVSRDLQRGRYAPVFDVDPRHDEVLWEIWMGGFERAMALHPESWMAVAQDDADEAAALAMAGMMALIAIADRGEDMDPEKIAALTEAAPDLIPGWVEILNAWRLRGATDRPAPTRSSKVGRNEPCPCGSGKKYKKCCGLN